MQNNTKTVTGSHTQYDDDGDPSNGNNDSPDGITKMVMAAMPNYSNGSTVSWYLVEGCPAYLAPENTGGRVVDTVVENAYKAVEREVEDCFQR